MAGGTVRSDSGSASGVNDFDFDRASFDRIASIYEKSRPGYSKEVYDCIDSIKAYTEDSLILEVGAGSGIATKEIADRWNPEIIAMEPGSNLRLLAKARLKDYRKVKVVGSMFEDYEDGGLRFDGIFSATAFHWIDPEIKYKKAFNLLKDDGLLVLYWNNYGIGDEKLSRSIEDLYAKYEMKKDAGTARERQMENIKRRREEIENSGLFRVISHSVFRNEIPYSARKYENLLKTFSDHSKDKVPDIDSFFREVRRVLNEHNGIIDVDIKVNLEIACKNLSPASAHGKI